MVKGWSWTAEAEAEARASGSPWLFVRCRMGDRRLDVLYVLHRHGRALAGWSLRVLAISRASASACAPDADGSRESDGRRLM
jgi:hypothetical protein